MIDKASIAVVLMSATFSSISVAVAQDYPARPIRVVNPYPAGTTTDVISRIFLDDVTKKLGQSFHFDYKPGAAGIVGTRSVLASPADGYTLLVQGTTMSTVALADPAAQYKMEDFTPIAILGSLSLTLAVPKSFQATTFNEFVADVRKNPGRYNFGSIGSSSMARLSSDRLLALANLSVESIEYKGAPDALRDLMAGQIQMLLQTTPMMAPQVRAGSIRALAVAAEKRSHLLPDVPTFRELGMQDMASSAWFGLFVRAGTPAAIVEKLRTVMFEVASSATYKERAEKTGVEALVVPANEIEGYIKTDLRTWENDIRRSKTAARK